MNACDPELKIENLRRLASRNAGREIKLTRKQICKAYEDIQEGNLPLPPLVLSKDRTHMVDKKSPLKLKDYDVLFKSSSKLVALRRIARKIGLTQLDNITKAKLVENIKNRLVSLKIHEQVILVKPRTKKTVTSEFSNNTVSNGNSAYNNTATSGNSMNNMGNSAYNNSGNSGNAMNNSANNTGGNNNSRAMNTNAPVNSTSNAPVGNTNNSRAPARTSAMAFPNKVSITGTPRFLGGGGVKYGGGPGIFGRMFGGGKKKTNAPRTNAPKANTPNVPKKPNAPKTNDPKANTPNVPKKPNAPNVPKKPNAPTPPPAPPVPGRPMVTVNNLTKGKKLITVKAHLKTKSKLTNV